MNVRQLSLVALSLVALTSLCAALWSFVIEDLLDPYLPGDHVFENVTERWEFVVVTTLLVALAAGVTLLAGLHALRVSERQQRIQSMVYEGFLRDPGAAFTTDGERRVVVENDRCRALLEPHFGSLLGRSFHELLPIDLTDTRYLQLEIGLRDHGHWRGEFDVEGRQGEVRLELELVMVQHPSGVATSLHGTVHRLELRQAS